jgi:hypothetical protein
MQFVNWAEWNKRTFDDRATPAFVVRPGYQMSEAERIGWTWRAGILARLAHTPLAAEKVTRR